MESENKYLNSRTKISPLSQFEVNNLLPGFLENYFFALEKMQQICRAIGQNFVAPAAVFCDGENLKKLVAKVAQNSTAEKNDERAFAHFEISENAIYFDIDDFRGIDDDFSRKIILHEFLHAAVFDPEKGKIGFLNFGAPIPRDRFLDAGFFSWEIVAENVGADDPQFFSENRDEIRTTENLTNFLTKLISPKKYFGIKIGEKNFLFKKEILEKILNSCDEKKFSEFILRILRDENLESAEKIGAEILQKMRTENFNPEIIFIFEKFFNFKNWENFLFLDLNFEKK